MSVSLSFVSGGQTGVDRATLDVAMQWRLPYHGWCPAGRWAEDGRIPNQYVLRVTPHADPAQRTVWNVRDSDALLILGELPRSDGTLLAQRTGRRAWTPGSSCYAGEACGIDMRMVESVWRPLYTECGGTA